jgi:hypothetical protein
LKTPAPGSTRANGSPYSTTRALIAMLARLPNAAAQANAAAQPNAA